MSTADRLFDGAVSYEDELPFAWLPAAKIPKPFDSQRLAESNLRTLMTLAQIEERPSVAEDASAHDQEIALLHAKLDALIGVVGAVLPRFVALPPATSVHLSWVGVAWKTTQPPPVGETGYVELYLHPALLKVLRLPARVVRVADGEVRADFSGGPESCHEALERHVFQRHRRAIADRRTMSRRG